METGSGGLARIRGLTGSPESGKLTVMSLHEIGALIRAKPDEARTKILDALRAANGNRRRASLALGAGPRSIYRWIEKLELWDEVDEIREPLPAPPRAKDRIVNALDRAEGDTARAARALRMGERTLKRRMRELGVAGPESPATASPPAA